MYSYCFVFDFPAWWIFIHQAGFSIHRLIFAKIATNTRSNFSTLDVFANTPRAVKILHFVLFINFIEKLSDMWGYRNISFFYWELLEGSFFINFLMKRFLFIYLHRYIFLNKNIYGGFYSPIDIIEPKKDTRAKTLVSLN